MTEDTVSHYRMLGKLGEGGSAVVYRAEDLALGREVVLKVLSPEWSADYGRVARFQHEARTISSLNHPNICTIYEIAEHEGRHFIAMEFLDGEVLSRNLVGTRPLETDRLIELATQVADALDAAHAEGIVHRDLKPANIFVTRRDQVKLLDFGLAVLVPRRTAGRGGAAMPSLGLTGGTVPYMSPEQVRGENLDPRTDLFSLGVVIYEMATGRRPFIGATAPDVMDAILNQSPIPVREINPSVPAELERIVDKALEKNRKLRYQTASDVRADLQRLKRDLDSASSIGARARTTVTLKRPFSSPLRTRIAAAAAVVAIASGALFALKTRLSSARPDAPRVARTAGSDIALPAEVTPPRMPVPPSKTTSAITRLPRAGQPLPPSEKVVERDERSREMARKELRMARQKIDLRLYDQALETLRHVAADTNSPQEAVKAGFLIASIHETRSNTDDAMSAYLEVATRYPADARAPEALYRMAESTIKSKRPDREVEGRRILTEVVEKYPTSSWAPRALMTRAELEERQDLYQRDERLGGSVPSALVTYREMVQRYGSSGSRTSAEWKLARAYLAVKRFELAAATFEAIGARDGENQGEAWLAAGDVYEKYLKDPTRAKNAYARVLPSSPRYSQAQERLRK